LTLTLTPTPIPVASIDPLLFCYSVSADTIARWGAAGHRQANEAMSSTGSFLAVDETVDSKAGKSFEPVRIAGSSDVLTHANEWRQLWSKLPTRFRIKTVSLYNITRAYTADVLAYVSTSPLCATCVAMWPFLIQGLGLQQR